VQSILGVLILIAAVSFLVGSLTSTFYIFREFGFDFFAVPAEVDRERLERAIPRWARFLTLCGLGIALPILAVTAVRAAFHFLK